VSGIDLTGWAPEPVTTTDRVTSWSVNALAATLDVNVAAPLPPLWHWLGFLEAVPQSALGEDGHPADGHFLPPLPHRRRMIAGGRLRFAARLPVDEPIERVSTLAGVRVKQGRTGEMAFVTVRHEYRVAGRIAVTEEQDVVYRSQPPCTARPQRREPAPEPSADFRLDITPDEAMLFRFSALTYNTHRIHYDHPYVTAVEGYPGLVVHGPLLALLLLEIPRRHAPDREVTAFDYRLTAPAFAGERVVVTGSPEGDEMALAARANGYAESIKGVAKLSKRT
jgi:3-methylfumaryl-CoA hydratase